MLCFGMIVSYNSNIIKLLHYTRFADNSNCEGGKQLKNLIRGRKISERAYIITENWGAYQTSMMLIVGDRRAALIDSGTGTPGLIEYVREITDLPLILLHTHGHPDHIGGDEQLVNAGAERYLSHADLPLVKDCTHAERMSYVRQIAAAQMSGAEYDDFITFMESNLSHDCDMPFLDVSEGDIFDLGGATLGVTAFPGHTAGSLAYVYRETETIFLGDAIILLPFIFFGDTTVEDYLVTVRKFNSLKSGYREIYAGHSDNQMPEDLGDKLLEACMDVMAGAEGEPLPGWGDARVHLSHKGEGRHDSIGIAFNPNHIFMMDN